MEQYLWSAFFIAGGIMNIDMGIANRAFMKAGEEPITENDIKTNSTRWRTIKEIYHATILETLSNTEWTSQKKRAKLEEDYELALPAPTAETFRNGFFYLEDGRYVRAEFFESDKIYFEKSENFTDYGIKYCLPVDCAKPVALTDGGVFIVEGRYLYTDSGDAALLYVSDGFTGERKYITADPQPTSESFKDKTYFINKDDEYVKAIQYEMDLVYFEEIEEDYPEYEEPVKDPLLFEYLETRLAAKLALKITGNLQLYTTLYRESQLMENRAIKSTVSQSKNRDKGHEYWGDILGLGEI